MFTGCGQANKGEKIMSKFKVLITGPSGDKEGEFDTTDAINAAYLMGIREAVSAAILAHQVGVLKIMLEISGAETTVESLVKTGYLDNITVEEL